MTLEGNRVLDEVSTVETSTDSPERARNKAFSLTMGIGEVLRVVSTLKMVFGNQTTLSAAIVLLTVAQYKEIRMQKLIQASNLSSATVSRLCASLGLYKSRSNKESAGLLSLVENPEARKEKIVQLTSKGKTMMDALFPGYIEKP